jgi:hypothetical protein
MGLCETDRSAHHRCPLTDNGLTLNSEGASYTSDCKNVYTLTY